jgi:4-hydroxy-tetrahydrodipicolinate reductase
MIPIKLAIAGASGRMGRMLIEACLSDPAVQLTVALDQAGSPAIGQDAGATLGRTTGVRITDDLSALSQANCLIDFTRPAGTLEHLRHCREYGVRMVIGTTGFDADGKAAIRQAAKDIGIVFAPNMSVGVNVLFRLLEVAADVLKDYDVEIFEAHHRLKVDAPSGTALGMGEVIARRWGRELDEIADWARHGETGVRQSGRIGFSVLRGGDIVGDHTAFFCGQGERIEITHRSNSRATYAQGSLRAARFLQTRGAGLFDMQDVLGLKT